MKKTILAVGIACVSVLAAAQSDQHLQKKQIVHRDLAAREAVSGQPAQDNVTTAREASSGMATGRMMGSNDGQAQGTNKNSMSGAQSNPMYKDNGSSGQNPLYEGRERTATKSRSNIQNNRMATGDVDGDGMADRAIVKSKSNITNNRVKADDANANVTPDASSDAPAQMKGDFSRGHQPDRKSSATSNGKATREAGSGMATGKRQHN